MNRYTMINLGVRLNHAKTTAQKEAVINSFPELKGRSVGEVHDLLMVNQSLITGKSVKQIEHNEELRREHLRAKYPPRRVRLE